MRNEWRLRTLLGLHPGTVREGTVSSVGREQSMLSWAPPLQPCFLRWRMGHCPPGPLGTTGASAAELGVPVTVLAPSTALSLRAPWLLAMQ